ncbi:unnamed protein product [Zymoseptoria tritici ST99CH_1A5]|uniref:Uncharacterized protein n=2 Tax=Zymoseptoria tritici TaxID=1047171 RepID=F9XLK1_ZYMTI|nr:uncharacterized protein MYCGRDRAFT_96134 [Zymoseptoria tritici IPO323]EGP84151.1 hypothetical protein MYCGRDRAFT_96134 [Zymoseptoria tritici IPO323]SMY28231.1 unnamed protein product [Zymoseptoria tritici ST99CH_1A5]
MGMNPFFGGQPFLPQNMISPAFGFGGMGGFGNGGGLQGWGGGLGGGFGGGGQYDVYDMVALGLWDAYDLEEYLEQMSQEASMQGIQIGADMQQYRDLVQMARQQQQQQQQVNVFMPGGGHGRGQGRARDQRYWKQLARGGGGGGMWGGMGGGWRGGWGGGWGGNGPRRGMGWNGVNRPGQLRVTGSPSPYNVPFNLRLTRNT